MTKKLLMGNEAFAHAALEAGVRVVAGYPGTPSSELIETVARMHSAGTAQGVHVEWSTNEKAALELAAGAAMGGARALFTCKQVGLNVASDALMSLNYVGVRGGLVLFVADDPGPISSQTEQDTRRFAAFAKVPVFDPATPEQGVAMMKAAFELSETYGRPVIVRPTTRINHASTFFDVADATQARPPLIGGFQHDSNRWVIFPKRSYEAHGEVNEMLRSVSRDFSNDPKYSQFNPIFENAASQAQGGRTSSAPSLGIVASGVSMQYVREALSLLAREAKRKGFELPNYRLMQIGTPFPFPSRSVRRFLEGLVEVLVLEELDSVVEEELLKLAGNSFLSARVHGKLTGEAPTRGENSTEESARYIARFFDAYLKPEEKAALAQTAAAATSSRSGGAHSASGTTGPIAYGNTIEQMANSHRQSPHSARYKAPGRAAAESARQQAAEAQAAASRSRIQDITFSELVENVIGPGSLVEYDGDLPGRPPVLCAGCPHRGSFYAVKNALDRAHIKREDAVLTGDIGCYTLGNAAPLDAVDTCLCMGAGITMAQGLQVVDPTSKHIAFVGDSTLFASGMTGIVNAVYNQHDITICVLDNSTTAMTGSQPHPGTGQTLMGPKSTPINIEKMLESMGVDFIVEADPLNREQAEAVSQIAIQHAGPSAIIFRSPCVWLTQFETPAEVDVAACTGCKRCITDIGCPAISFDHDVRGPKSGQRGQAFVDPDQCSGCGLCVQVCPFDALHVPDIFERAARTSAPTVIPVEELGDPVPPAENDPEPTDLYEEEPYEAQDWSEPAEEAPAPSSAIESNADLGAADYEEVAEASQLSAAEARRQHQIEFERERQALRDPNRPRRPGRNEPVRVFGGSVMIQLETDDSPKPKGSGRSSENDKLGNTSTKPTNKPKGAVRSTGRRGRR